MPDCSDVRRQWDEAFDAGEAPTTSVFQHLAACDACRTYAGAASSLRETLRDLPLGSGNDAADQAVLRALRSEAAPVVPVRRPVFPLVFAGAGSFALTLIVAGVMLLATSETPTASAPTAPAGVAAQPRYIVVDPDVPWNDWLSSPGLVAGIRGMRGIMVPAPPKPSPLRGESGGPGRVA